MPSPLLLPSSLRGRVFSSQEAHEAGLSKDVLNGQRIVSVHRGVHRYADTPLTPELQIAAARLLLPADAALSHLSALWWWGVTLRDPTPLHFSTNMRAQTRLKGVTLHRRQDMLHPSVVRGVPVLDPTRTLIDVATQLGHVDLVRAGDWLVRLALTTPEQLYEFSMTHHLNGVRRVRRIARHVRHGVESVTETDLRLLLRFGRLPASEVNTDILDHSGCFVARGDLPYREFMVLVEYDGWQHERDALQRQKDHLRREQLEALGWRVIVVTIEDMKDPGAIVARVHRALVDRGYVGPPPQLSDTWRRWFAA
ncbi:DUF559 domain-containing protein [Aeromicrobium sp. CF3.5]|uniref:DUF559 domain-containing protein n=1 Tax=Aeromicrobium sp. CF3.5 TaxID=3373078 RepID=UPI003EE589E0